jgi:hypothetical protein
LSRRWDSNPLPTVYDTVALPAELLRQYYIVPENGLNQGQSAKIPAHFKNLGGRMSFQTVHHEVTINGEQLLKLFLGQGKVQTALVGQIITIYEIDDLNVLRVENDVHIYKVKILGVSDDPKVSYVNGKATMKQDGNGEYVLSLELYLQDQFE